MLLVGQKPRNKLIHEQPSGTVKHPCNYKYIKSIWAEFDWTLKVAIIMWEFKPKEVVHIIVVLCLHSCEGKKVRVNPINEVIKEMSLTMKWVLEVLVY